MKPQIFLGAIVEYKGLVSIKFKKSDGVTIIDTTTHTLQGVAYARKETIYFANPVTDTDLTWELSDYTSSEDLVFNVEFISQTLEAGEPKLFTYVKVNHTDSSTIDILDSSGSSQGVHYLPANPLNQTIVAIKNPFYDNYGIIKTASGGSPNTLKGYQFVNTDISADLKLFTGAIVEYYNRSYGSSNETMTINFKKTDGTSILSSAHSLSKAGRNIDFISFLTDNVSGAVKDTDLLWSITNSSDDYDFVSKITFLSIPITQLTQDGTKHLFTHLEIEHTEAVTITVYDSSDTDGGSGDEYLKDKQLPVNSSGKTLVALQNPFVDYYGYITVSSGTVTSFRLLKATEEGA